MRSLFLSIFLFTLFVNAFSQTIIIASQKNGRQLKLKIGDRVAARFLNKGKRLINGKLVSFSDSTLTFKTRKGLRSIDIKTVSRLKKTNFSRALYSASAPAALLVISLTTYSISPLLIAAAEVPSVIVYDLITKNNLRAPLEIHILKQ